MKIEATNNAAKAVDFLAKLWQAVFERYDASTEKGKLSQGLTNAASKWRKLGRQPKAEFIFLYADEMGVEYSLSANF